MNLAILRLKLCDIYKVSLGEIQIAFACRTYPCGLVRTPASILWRAEAQEARAPPKKRLHIIAVNRKRGVCRWSLDQTDGDVDMVADGAVDEERAEHGSSTARLHTAL